MVDEEDDQVVQVLDWMDEEAGVGVLYVYLTSPWPSPTFPLGPTLLCVCVYGGVYFIFSSFLLASLLLLLLLLCF